MAIDKCVVKLKEFVSCWQISSNIHTVFTRISDAYLIFCVSGAAYWGQRLFKRLIPQRQKILIVQFNLLHEYFFMAYRLEANLSFGFLNSLINTFLQVFNNSLLDVNVLTVAESSKDLTQWLQCIFIILWKCSNKRHTGAVALTPCAALNRGRHLFGGGTYSSKYGISLWWVSGISEGEEEGVSLANIFWKESLKLS